MWTGYTDQLLHLHLNEVHLWYLNVEDHKNRLAVYEELLDNEEKEKAYRYKFDKDRNCSIIARGVLRTLLGSYSNELPERITFSFGPFGKPEVYNNSGIQFNISHSRDAIVLGFIKNDAIGVDVEFMDEKIDALQIAKHFFSNEERVALSAVSEDERVEAFYNCWTRKEAFIKALGDGLSFPLDQFVVSLTPALKAELLKTKWDQMEKEKWALHSFNPEKKYVSAFTVNGKVSDIKLWKYL